MEIIGSIDVVVTFSRLPLIRALSALLEGGWTNSYLGKVLYMVTGEECDWYDTTPDDMDNVIQRISAKLNDCEVAGILLAWPETDNLGELLFFPHRQLSFTWSIGRRRLDSLPWTDYSWYLSRILGPLERAGFQIESVTCRDCEADKFDLERTV